MNPVFFSMEMLIREHYGLCAAWMSPLQDLADEENQ